MLAPWFRCHPPAVVVLLSFPMLRFPSSQKLLKTPTRETAQKNLRKACMFFYYSLILVWGEKKRGKRTRNNIFISFYYISLEIHFFPGGAPAKTKESSDAFIRAVMPFRSHVREWGRARGRELRAGFICFWMCLADSKKKLVSIPIVSDDVAFFLSLMGCFLKI